MKQIKRAIALFLVLALCLSLFPSVFAADSSTDIPQGTLDPDNYSAASGEVNIAWNNIRNVYSYTLRFMIKQGNSYYLLDRQIIPASDYKIGEQIKVVLNDWVTTYGPGTYMATLDMEMYGTSSSTPAERQIEISQLDAPTGVTINTNGVVSWNSVEGNHGYEVTVKVGENAETFTTAQDVVNVDASAFIKTYAAANPAADVTATVVALGNLDDPYRVLDSASSAAGTLDKQVGVLPTPVIANPNVVSEGGKLYVEYQLEAGSVDASYIDEITLTLTGKDTSASGTYTVSAADVIAVGETGRIDVTRLGNNNLPHDTYTAVLNATPKYPTLNEATFSTGEVTYSVKQVLPAPELEIDNAGTELTWSPVKLSVGELDSTADYVVKYKLSTETDWEKATIPSGDAIQKVGDKFVLDLEALGLTTGTYYDFKVIANNAEDLTIETTSESYIQFFKTNAVSDAAIVADNDNDAVKVTWTNPDDTTGIAKYQVDVYVDGEVVKTFYTADASAEELDISAAIDADQVKTYTVKVTAIGQHDLRPDEALFYADSATVAGSNDVTSGTVQAADIVFETPEGASTTYKVYFNGDDNETAMPVNVEGYAVTISYKLKNGGTGSWSGTLNVPFCDIAQLENADGTKFLLASWNVYVDATFTVEATALSNNTALHANAEPQTETDVFSLTPISELLNPQISTDTSGKTWVTWALVEGAKEYAVEVQKNGTQVYKGFANVNQANITGWLNSAGKYTVTVTAYPYDGSTAFVTGSASVTVTVLAAPAEVEITLSDDTATASWEEVANAEYYLVTVKKDGTAITGYENVQVEDTEYVLTDIIKANGAGTYTVEVTAVGDGSAYITSLEPGTAEVSISELTTPTVTFALNKSKKPVVTITANPDETVSSYTVYLYANGALFETLTGQQAGEIDVTTYVADYKTAESAVELSAKVEAVGRLEDGTLSSSVFGSAALDRKAGLLPSIEITHTQIVQEDGVLKVKYQLTDTGVGLDAISNLKLTLKAKSGTPSYTLTINQPAAATGYFDVTKPDGENVLPAGEYVATISVSSAYTYLNGTTKVTNHPMSYAVNTLPAPDLQVSADGSRLYWEAIPMSDGKAIDQVSEFTLKVWKNDDAAWVSEAVANQIKYDEAEGIFYVNLTNLLKNYAKYQITATNNGEDVSYTGSSVAEITISKLADVSDVTVSMDTTTDTVVASWTAPASTTGLDTYQVELLVLGEDGTYSVAETYTTEATSFTFPDDAIDQAAANTYKVRVTAIGVHGSVTEGSVAKGDVKTAFVADSNPVESTSTVASGSVPTVAETGTIYEENGKLYLKVELEDSYGTYNKIEKITLNSLTNGSITYTKAVNGQKHASDDAKAYVTFDLSKMYGEGKLTSGKYTADISVVSKCEQLNASTQGQTKITYKIDALDMGALSVNSVTGEITWDALEGAAGYNVLVSYDLGQTTSNWVASTSAQDNILSYHIQDVLAADKTLEPGRVYTVTVTAYSDTTMTNPTGDSSSVQVCKLTAPTDPAVSVDSTKATASWTLSTLNNCKDNYLVSVVAADETSYSNTTTGRTINLNSAKLLKASSAAPAGAYTVTVQTKAKAGKAVDDVYYVDSDTVSAPISAYKGTLPADEISNVSVSWGANSSLMLNYQLPVATGVTDPFELALIKAIDYNNIEIEVSYGDTVIGKYTGTASATTGVGTVDITKGTESALAGKDIGSLYAGEDISVKFTLASNYVLIKGAASTADANIPSQGVISFIDFNVDVTDGKVTFTGDPHATGYSAVLQEVGSTSSETIAPSAEQRSTVYTFDLSDKLTAGKTYTLTITGKDTTGQYKDGVKEITLYKLVDPQITTTNRTKNFLKLGEFIYEDDANAPGKFTTTVTVDNGQGTYADGKVTFNKTLDLHEATLVVDSNGGQVENTDTYILDAENTATMTTVTGKIPAYQVKSIRAMGDNTEQVTFQFADSSVSALWSKLYAQCTSLIQLSGPGTYGSFVYATNNGNTVTCHSATSSDRDMSVNTATGVLTANFGMQATNHLISGQTYDMRVVAYAKNEVKAILGNSESVIEDVVFNRNQLQPSISINTQTGMLVISGMDDAYVKQVEMQVDGSANMTVVKNGDNIFTVAGITDNNVHTLTFTAIANSAEMADSAPVTIEVKQLPDTTAVANTDGELDVTGYTDGVGKLSVTVNYTDAALEDLEQTVGALDDLNGYVDADVLASAYGPVTVKTQAKGERVTVNGVDRFYVSAAVKTETSSFSVGQLPAVKMGDALTKQNDNWVIPYELDASSELYGTLQLKLTTGLVGQDVTIKADSFTGNGYFDVNDFVTRFSGTYDYELTSTGVQYPAINSFEPQAEKAAYSYSVGQLQAPAVTVNTTTGELTWTAVDNAKSYSVKIGDTETDLKTALSYKPTLTAGQEQVITIIANPESGDYTANSATVTLYKLANPVINTVNTDPDFLKSGTFAYTADSTSYDYDTIVTVDGDDGKYENGVVTFDLTKALHEATIEVALKGKAGANDVYTIDADSTDTMTTVTGQIPAYKMDSKTVLANGNVEVKFSFKNEADAELWAKLYQQSKSLLQLSGTGTYGTFVYAEKDQTSIACHSVTTRDKDIVLSNATGNITAIFGLSGNALQSGVDYDFRVVAYGKSEVAAVLENSTTVIDADAFEITKLAINPTVNASGNVTFGMTPDDVAATDYVNVTYKGTTKQITENANLYTLFGIDAANVSLNTFTFQAVAEDATRENSDPVNIKVQRLRQVQVTLNEYGTFSVSGFNKNISTFSVALAGTKLDGSKGYSKSYSAPANGSDFVTSNNAQWLKQDLQTIVATTTTRALTDNKVNDVFYLNAADKYVAPATEFYVGKLPAVTLGALTKQADKWVIPYTLSSDVSADLYGTLKLKLGTDLSDGASADASDFAGVNGVFDVSEFIILTGTFDAELTAENLKYPNINSFETQFEADAYTYEVGKLAAPDVQVNVETGELTWATNANVTNYKVSVKDSGKEEDVAPVAGTTSYTPALTAGTEAVTYEIWAESTDEQWDDSEKTEVTLYKLKTPVISINDENDTFTVTDSNTNPTGTLVVKVDGSVVTADENGVYTAPVEYGEYTVTAVVEGEGYDADTGIWTLSSETVSETGNKLGAQLAPPTGLKVTVSSGLLAWNAVENATGYEVKVGDADPVTVTETKCTPTLAVGENTVTITAVTTDSAYSNSEAASVVLYKLPDLGELSIGSDGAVNYVNNSGISDPYKDTTVTVKVTKADEYTDTWNAETKVVDFDTDAEVHTVTIKVSVAGKTYTNDAKEKVYLIRPDIYSQTIKVQAGKMPEFEIEDVTTDGVDETVVTFVTDSTEDLSTILNTDAVKDSFVYQYEKDGEGEGTWNEKPSTVEIEDNKLIVTLDTKTSTNGYTLTYSFDAAPVSSMAGYRGTAQSNDSITFNGNKLETPVVEVVMGENGVPVLTWNAVEGASEYYLEKHLAGNDHVNANYTVTDTQKEVDITSANTEVCYRVTAKGTGVTDSDPVEVTLRMLSGDEVTFGFNATPVNVTTGAISYKLTLAESADVGTTVNNLKKMTYFTTDTNHTVSKTNATSKIVFDAQEVAGQHTMTITGYILGEINGVYYYSKADIAPTATFIYGELATAATEVSNVAATAKTLTIQLESLQKTMVDATNSYVSVVEQGAEEAVMVSGITVGATYVRVPTTEMGLKAGTTYNVTVVLVPKSAAGTQTTLTCTLTTK